jgi:hypothetical protein
MKETIAFVGVGRMGANMARRIKDQGYQVTAVFDSHTPLAVELGAEIGAEAAKTLARLNELASVIITVVTDDKAMRAIFAEQGDRPTAYIAGEEAAGAAGVGLRYGRGALHMKDLSASQEVFWQGISIGWDVGGNASRVFTLVYGLYHPDMLYRRYPGVEGTAYLVGGLGVNYQRADGIILAPIRTGVGLRAGANVGTMAYSRQRNLLPF